MGTEPRRPLTRETSLGFEVADFARDILDEPLLPWQEQAAVRALELNPDGTFRFRTVVILVARQSGKTHLLRTVALWRLFVDQADLILSVAQSLDIAREAWRAGCQAVEDVEDLRAERNRVSRVNGDEYLLLSSGARWKIGAANRSAGRGLSVDMLVMDELREQRSWDAWSALSKTTQARRRGQTWCISNAGDDQSVVLNHLRSAALAGEDDSICLLEWSAPDGCAMDDRQAWAQANPGLGHTVSEAAIRSSLATDPEPVFRTEVLCQHVPALKEPPIRFQDWLALADASSEFTGRPVFSIVVARDLRSAGIFAAGHREDGRTHVEIVEHRSGVDWVVERAAELKRHRPIAWVLDKKTPAAALLPDLKAAGIKPHEMNTTEYAQACSLLQSVVRDGSLVHLGDEVLLQAVAGADRRDIGEGWAWNPKTSEVDIVPLVGVTLAHWLLSVTPKPRPLVAYK